jgi:hypothetical protein
MGTARPTSVSPRFQEAERGRDDDEADFKYEIRSLTYDADALQEALV